MKKYIFQIAGCRMAILFLLLLLTGTSLRAADPVTLNIATMAGGQTALGMGLKHWAAGVNSKTDGRIVLRVLTDGASGDETSILESMENGKIDGGVLSAWTLAKLEQDIVAACLPYSFERPANYLMFLQFIQDQVAAKFAEKGYFLADLCLGGDMYLLSKEKIESPQALLKEKFAVKNQIEASYWGHFGMKTTEVRPADFSKGFQSGKFTAFAMAPLLVKQLGMGELPRSKQTFMLEPSGVLFRKASWEKLSPEDRRFVVQSLESLLFGAGKKGFDENTQFELPGYKSKSPLDLAKKDWSDFFEAGKNKVISEMLSEEMRKKLLEANW